MSDQNDGRHYSVWLKWISIAIILVCVVVLFRVLPLDRAVELLKDYVNGLGFWGPIVFGLIYVLATILLVPGTILTLAAGAIFGLGWGIVIVSLSSITGASLAFLIGRYLARNSVEKMAKNSDKFAAVDEAVAEGGWKVIALLRLSPAVPFTYQNYLLGLTKIRFWTYALTSWPAMLPGTAMYVYLGAVGGAAAEGGLTIGQWVLLGVGLLATIAVTVYITILAKKKLRERTDIEDDSNADAAAEEEPSEDTEAESEEVMQNGWTKGAIFAVVLALVMIVVTGCAFWKRGAISSLFGPPAVEMSEKYQKKPDGPTFDHSTFDALLAKHVNSAGGVDYGGFRGDEAKLDEYIAALGDAPFAELGRDEKLAMLINAYNAFTIKLILENAPVKSIQDIPGDKRWKAERWKVGENTWSLDQIENEQIRPNFEEPRIHWALVCAAVSCPPLRAEAFTADKLEEQLESQAQTVFNSDKWFSYDRQNNLIKISPITNWYRGDFEQSAGSLVKYIAEHSSMVKAAVGSEKEPKIEFLGYDWTLNSQENVPAGDSAGGEGG